MIVDDLTDEQAGLFRVLNWITTNTKIPNREVIEILQMHIDWMKQIENMEPSKQVFKQRNAKEQ